MNESLEGMILQANLLWDGTEESDNPEYLRGMCELIARCFPVDGLMTDERAEAIKGMLK